MKPDKFDESIRRKLEGIQPSFQEDDWAKFTAYQAAHAPSSFSFIKHYGRALMYSAASVAAAVMVFANVYQYRQNKQLDQQLSQLKSTLAQKNDAPIRVSYRVDTVYITKYINGSFPLTAISGFEPIINTNFAITDFTSTSKK